MTPIVTAPTRREVEEWLTGAEGLFVALDFDGTLAPIVADPDEATIAPTCRRALERFVTIPNTSPAVVSGRSLADIRERIGIGGLVYGGNHGLELQWRERATVHPVVARCRPAIRRAVDRLADRLTGIPGWNIEDKGPTATVHVRRTPATRVDEVRSAVTTTVDEAEPELRVETGKEVFEIRPAIDWDKGAALTHLVGRVPDTWRTVYLGDDVTDEDAFRVLGRRDLGVLVGPERRTAAGYRLPTQDAVGPFLHWLADGTVERPCDSRT